MLTVFESDDGRFADLPVGMRGQNPQILADVIIEAGYLRRFVRGGLT